MMDLMPLALENLPIKGLSEIADKLNRFDDDSRLTVLGHEVTHSVVDDSIEIHALICELKDSKYRFISNYVYINYELNRSDPLGLGILVRIIPSHVYDKITRALNNKH